MLYNTMLLTFALGLAGLADSAPLTARQLQRCGENGISVNGGTCVEPTSAACASTSCIAKRQSCAAGETVVMGQCYNLGLVCAAGGCYGPMVDGVAKRQSCAPGEVILMGQCWNPASVCIGGGCQGSAIDDLSKRQSCPPGQILFAGQCAGLSAICVTGGCYGPAWEKAKRAEAGEDKVDDGEQPANTRPVSDCWRSTATNECATAAEIEAATTKAPAKDDDGADKRAVSQDMAAVFCIADACGQSSIDFAGL